MDILDLMKKRRSIRKYQDRQIDRKDLEKIIGAGLYAPNAGGGQRARIIAVHNRALTAQIGRLKLARFDRSRLAGGYVSAKQPSNIDDPTIKNGFYGAPAVCIIFGARNFYTVFPMHSAVQKIWCLRPHTWGSHPVSLPEGRKPLTTLPAQHC